MAGKPRQMSEREAHGDVERVLYEMRQVLRLTGLEVTVRTWAGFGRFLVGVWEALGPNVETRAFEEAADRVRAEAVEAAESLGQLGAWGAVSLGESQRYHLRGALELYHDMNAKVLVLTSAVHQALAGQPVGQGLAPGSVERLARGVPERMAAMEVVSERPEDSRLRALFKDILQSLGPPSLPMEYRAGALWPHYLEAVWERLKPRMQGEDYQRARDALRLTAERVARELPYTVVLPRERVEGWYHHVEQVVRVTEQFEQRLPALVLNVALLAQEVPELELRRPFPAEAWRGPALVEAGVQA